jgi:CubicO group peptidase (beta-lactamase class C family)
MRDYWEIPYFLNRAGLKKTSKLCPSSGRKSVVPKSYKALYQLIPVFLVLMVLDRAPLLADEIPPPPAVAPTPIPTDTPVPFHYQIPKDLSDGWPVGDLRKEKADFKKINHAVELLPGEQWAAMRSLLIFRHGRLLLEAYFNGTAVDSAQPLYSCTKSVFSTVYGIAQDQGLLSLDQRISDLYPGSGKEGWGPEKAGITIGSMLSMTSGLDCDDVGVGSGNCGAEMGQSKDWLAFCFSRPVAHPVGTFWMYNGCCLSLISNLIAQKSGMSFADYAQKYLLGPLGIDGDSWVTGPGGVNRVDYGLAWKARDMAKLGQLYLNGGMWKGKRIVSMAWVKDATSLHCTPGTAFGHSYGYLWHLKDMNYEGKPVKIFFANGYQGQDIFVSPDADLVCVMTAASDDYNIYSMEEGLFETDILGAFH